MRPLLEVAGVVSPLLTSVRRRQQKDKTEAVIGHLYYLLLYLVPVLTRLTIGAYAAQFLKRLEPLSGNII